MAIVISAYELLASPIAYRQWLILAALTLLSGSVTVKVPSVPATISVSETFVFTAVLLFGPSAGTITVALDGLVISLWLRKKNAEAYRVLFNVTAPSLAIWISAHLYFLLAGTPPLSQPHTPPINQLLIPLLAFTISYFLLNSWLIAFAIAWEKNLSARRVWRENFFWLSLNFFGGASVAALLVAYTRHISASAVGVIVPLLIISYLTYKTYMGRLEDTTRHLSELNQLYLSTIETLAMAIDAKDQITHGHIRRVQTYAIGLARRLGVQDEALIKAIEAAALLHDIGKIGVPEHILNKPGKLTAAEFEQMKLHASIGGDLVSSIHFKDLVAPIVRHHHESWDGTGYPDGLSGTQIPIGARILAVVDCFDALTSDRPYRPKLPDDAALAILIERRGTMYDPLVVDAFLAVLPELSRQYTDVVTERPAFKRLKDLVYPSLPAASEPFSSGDPRSSPTEDVLGIIDALEHLSGSMGLRNLTEIVSGRLRKVIPATTCVFYLCDPSEDQLVASQVHGAGQIQLTGHRIRLGHNVSGWAAVNQHVAVNADAQLDLGDIASAVEPALHSCLSVPMLVDRAVIGVLSLYSSKSLSFSEEHARLVEIILGQVSKKVRDAIEFDRDSASSFRDGTTGLPNLRRLNELVGPSGPLNQVTTHPVALLLVDIRELKELSRRHGPSLHDAVMSQVARLVRGALRAADMLFRAEGDELAVLLAQTDAQTADAISWRIMARVGEEPVALPDGDSVALSAQCGVAMSPDDGTTIDRLIAAARTRMVAPREPGDAMLWTVH